MSENFQPVIATSSVATTSTVSFSVPKPTVSFCFILFYFDNGTLNSLLVGYKKESSYFFLFQKKIKFFSPNRNLSFLSFCLQYDLTY